MFRKKEPGESESPLFLCMRGIQFAEPCVPYGGADGHEKVIRRDAAGRVCGTRPRGALRIFTRRTSRTCCVSGRTRFSNRPGSLRPRRSAPRLQRRVPYCPQRKLPAPRLRRSVKKTRVPRCRLPKFCPRKWASAPYIVGCCLHDQSQPDSVGWSLLVSPGCVPRPIHKISGFTPNRLRPQTPRR